MAQRVFLHAGLPKTGTTYLQRIVWSHRDELRAAGLLLPGRERREHLWASCVVREDPHLGDRHPRAAGAWERLQQEIVGWDADALVSHEFFCSASAEQAEAMVQQLAPAEVHLVLTARQPLSLFTASWQESLKNRGTTPLAAYAREVSADPLEIWNWRALDLGLVLERWAQALPPERIHVVTVPGRGAPRDLLWQRFASVLGTGSAVADTTGAFPNESMGVVEAETLRRINASLEGFTRPVERGVWIRGYLADDRLVPRGGEKYWPAADQVEDCRARGERAVATVREGGFDVVGDLEELRVPAELEERRHPDSVTDAEVIDVATDLVVRLLKDTRELTQQVDAQHRPARGPAEGPASRAASPGGTGPRLSRAVREATEQAKRLVRRHPRLLALARRVRRRG